MRKRISNPITQIRKLRLSLNCMLRVTGKERSWSKVRALTIALADETEATVWTSVGGTVIRRWPAGAGSREQPYMADRGKEKRPGDRVKSPDDTFELLSLAKWQLPQPTPRNSLHSAIPYNPSGTSGSRRRHCLLPSERTPRSPHEQGREFEPGFVDRLLHAPSRSLFPPIRVDAFLNEGPPSAWPLWLSLTNNLLGLQVRWRNIEWKKNPESVLILKSRREGEGKEKWTFLLIVKCHLIKQKEWKS